MVTADALEGWNCGGRRQGPVLLRLRELPLVITPEALTAWRTEHLNGHSEPYAAAIVVVRAALAAEDLTAGARHAWQQATDQLATLKPRGRR